MTQDDGIDNNNDDSSIVHRIRKMETLTVGDMVEYNDPLKVAPSNLFVGMVKSIDRKLCQTVVTTEDVLMSTHYLRRMNGCDSNTKKW